MDWTSLIGPLAKFGVPILATALGVPELAPVAGALLAKFLGVEPTPDAVQQAVTANPAAIAPLVQAAEGEAAAKWAALAQIAQAQAELGKVAVAEVNTTIRAEVAGGDGLLGRWRGIHAWELTAECPFWAATLMWCVLSGNTVGINGLMNLSGLITAYFAARFGVLGVHVWQGSNERQAAIAGIPAPAEARTAAAAAAKRR